MASAMPVLIHAFFVFIACLQTRLAVHAPLRCAAASCYRCCFPGLTKEPPQSIYRLTACQGWFSLTVAIEASRPLLRFGFLLHGTEKKARCIANAPLFSES